MSNISETINNITEKFIDNEAEHNKSIEKIIHVDNKESEILNNEENKLQEVEKLASPAVIESNSKIDEENAKNDEWVPILGSDVILMKEIKAGQSDEKPQQSDKCIINYKCSIYDNDSENQDLDNLDFIENEKNFALILSEGDVIPGLEVSIQMMSKNQRCLFRIESRLAYGEKGNLPKIPPDTTLLYDVELIDIQQNKPIYELSVSERLKLGLKNKERGNWWYQRDDNRLAIQCYRHALNYLDEELDIKDAEDNSELQEMVNERIKIWNNMASAQIKLKLYSQAVVPLERVLRCQPDNVKALYRRAKIHVEDYELVEALALLKKAQSLGPSVLISKDIAQIMQQREEDKRMERARAQAMIGIKNDSNETNEKAPMSTKNFKLKKFGTWAACGTATVLVAIASLAAYRIKYW